MKKKALAAVIIGIFLCCGTIVWSKVQTLSNPAMSIKQSQSKHQKRDQQITRLLNVLKGFINKPMPRGFTPQQQNEWAAQKLWFQKIYKWFRAYQIKLRRHLLVTSRKLSKRAPNQPNKNFGLTKNSNQLDKEFVAKKSALLRKFNSMQPATSIMAQMNQILESITRNLR